MHTPVTTIWNNKYCTDAAPLTSTTKQARVMQALRPYSVTSRDGRRLFLNEVTPGQSDYLAVGFRDQEIWSDIKTVHDPAYVEAVRTGEPRDLAESQWFTWSPAFAQSVMHIWAGHRVACQRALTDRIVLHPVSGAHHAGLYHGAGFCTFNYLVGAGRWLLRTGRVAKIGIIDLDAHYGDGTFALTSADERFVHFDISGYGAKAAVRGSRFFGVRNTRGYRAALQHLDVWLDIEQPGFVIYQAGADPLDGDTLGGMHGVTVRDLYQRDLLVLRALATRQIPTVVTFAGGYVPNKTEQVHINTVRAIWHVLNGLTREIAIPASTIWQQAKGKSMEVV